MPTKRTPKRPPRSEPLVPMKARLAPASLGQPTLPTPKQYCKPQPCSNCPYRQDAPRRLWDIQEFITLQHNEESDFGEVYGCHKQDGCVCTGFLLHQDKNDFPSIRLRISLSRYNISREFLDSLHSPSPLFESVEAMCKANYPEFFTEE